MISCPRSVTFVEIIVFITGETFQSTPQNVRLNRLNMYYEYISGLCMEHGYRAAVNDAIVNRCDSN